MENYKKLSFICLFLGTTILTVFTFQNCSKVNYAEQDAGTKISGQSQRVISINPTFQTEGADLKVLFVVDDSFTMKQSQERLSFALDSLINPLYGRNVEFKVVSTSGIPDNEIDYKIDRKYLSINGDEISESTALSSQNYFIEKNISNRSYERHAKIQSLKNFNQAQFNNLKSILKQTVLQVGTNGSDTEEGFCPVLRQLFDHSSSSFFKQGDKAAIILLTDEDDSSTYESCVSKYQEKVSSSPVVYYSYLQQRAKLTLEYQVSRDGIKTWLTAEWGVGLPNGQYFVQGNHCNPSDLSIAANIIASKGYVIRNISKCVYASVETTHYGADLGDDGSITNKNLCSSQVKYQGATYSNLYAFITASGLSAVNGSCNKIIQPANSILATGNYTSVISDDPQVAETNLHDLRTALIDKSNALFGSGYIVASIIRKNNESCALQPGQSYGTKYEGLSSQIPNNSIVESLCASNFSSVLSKVSNFIVNSASKSYSVNDIKNGEIILGITINKSGTKTVLTSSQYEVVGNSFTLFDINLQSGDIIELSVGSP